MNKFYFVSLTFFATILFCSCKEETDSQLPYTGAWKTDVYTVQVDESGSLMNHRIVLVLQDETFTDTVYHVIGHLEQPVVCGDGNLEQIGEENLNFLYARLGTVIGNEISWDSSGSAGFDSLFIQYIEPVMPVEFDAEYSFSNSSMDLFIAETGDTIHLFSLY